MHSMHFHYVGIINHSLSNDDVDEGRHAQCEWERVQPCAERAAHSMERQHAEYGLLKSQGAPFDSVGHPVLGPAQLCG